MGVMTVSEDLRQHVADLLSAVGPAAPTLCEGWDARDLAAHLVIRDHRPDAVPGMLLPALAPLTQRVQDRCAAQPFDRIVAEVRQGPPRWNPMHLPAIDARANLVELGVHATDIVAAQPESVRADLPPLPAGAEDALWRVLPTVARLRLRRARVRVTAVRPDGARAVLTPTVPAIAQQVELRGDAAALLTALSGRPLEACHVEIDGPPAACVSVRTLLG